MGLKDPKSESLRTRAVHLVCRRLHAQVKKFTDHPPLFAPNVSTSDKSKVVSPSRDTIARALNPNNIFPDPPAHFDNWLETNKNLRRPTRKLYKYCIRKLLGFILHLMPDQEPSIWYAWDPKLISLFFSVLKPHVAPSSLPNFHSAFQCLRLYMLRQGNRPDDYADLYANFAGEAQVAQRARRDYIRDEKFLSTKEKGVLKKFFLEVYHSAQIWEDFNQKIKRMKKQKAAGQGVTRLTAEELTMATGFMICLITATNFKRAGNFALIESEPAYKSLNQAFCDFKFRFPEEKVDKAPLILDPEKCVPAVIDIPQSSKKGDHERLVILSPKVVRALLFFHKFVRKYAPIDVKTTKFFFNAKGAPLGKDVYFWLRKITSRVGMKDLTFNTLRHAIETENLLHDDNMSAYKALVSHHLGHSEKTAEQYYRIRDSRDCVKASYRLLHIQEILAFGGSQKAPIRDMTEPVYIC